MSTPAVTPAAPAAARTSTTNSEFLPSDKSYRLTGEMPSSASRETKEEEEASAASVKENQEHENQSVNEGESAASKSETAAASEAATTQEKKGPAQSKDEKTGESRWAKITRENREMRERLARLEAAPKTTPTSEETQRDKTQTSQPATDTKSKGRTEPQIEDVDPKTGKAKYATLKDYLADHSKWNREEAVREFEERSSKTQREEQQRQTEKIIEKTVNDRVEAIRKSYPDYDDVAAAALTVKDDLGRDAIFYTKGSHLDGFFLDSDRGHEVLNHIFRNMDETKHIFARDAAGKYLLNPVRQLRELAKIENTLPDKAATSAASGKSTSASSARPITQAPPPPNRVSGKGTVTKDALETAVEEGDTETYMREQNARALARLKKG
jgi:hypothetical protein